MLYVDHMKSLHSTKVVIDNEDEVQLFSAIALSPCFSIVGRPLLRPAIDEAYEGLRDLVSLVFSLLNSFVGSVDQVKTEVEILLA